MTAASGTKAIVFDLDGTLIDSAPDIAAALNVFLITQGTTALATELVEQFIGNGPRSLVECVLEARSLPTDDASIDQALAAYLDNYARAPATLTRFFDHVREDLDDLTASGFRLGICTNKPHALTHQILGVLEIDHLFEVALGADAVERRKPDAAHLLAVIDAMGLSKEEVAYVGDTDVDKMCATRAGVPFFVVSWGGGMAVDEENATRIRRLADLKHHLIRPDRKEAS